MSLFRRKKKETPQDAIAHLRDSIEMLDKREEFLNKKIQEQLALAKKYNAAGNKRMAVSALKRKKMLMDQQQKIAGARDKIEQQMYAIEGAKTNMEALRTMQKGTSALKDIHKDMTAEKVDQVMDDMQDQLDVEDQISQAFGQQIGDVIDEDELLGELDEIEEGQIEEDIMELPSAGRAKAKAKPQPTEEEDMAELEAALEI